MCYKYKSGRNNLPLFDAFVVKKLSFFNILGVKYYESALFTDGDALILRNHPSCEVAEGGNCRKAYFFIGN